MFSSLTSSLHFGGQKLTQKSNLLSQTFSTLVKKLSIRVQLIESVMIESHLEWAWTSHQEIATAELLEARAESLLPLTQSSIVLNYLRRHHHKFEKGATTQLLVLCNRTAVHNNAPTPCFHHAREGGIRVSTASSAADATSRIAVIVQTGCGFLMGPCL
jgi:hypothetical protein